MTNYICILELLLRTPNGKNIESTCTPEKMSHIYYMRSVISMQHLILLQKNRKEYR